MLLERFRGRCAVPEVAQLPQVIEAAGLRFTRRWYGGFVDAYRRIWIELPGRHASLAAAVAAAAEVSFEHREAG